MRELGSIYTSLTQAKKSMIRVADCSASDLGSIPGQSIVFEKFSFIKTHLIL